MFFFFGWEGNQWGKPSATVGTVPTDAEKGGNFSALLALGSQYQIYDPLSTPTATGGHFSRTPFAGNIIPVNRIDPAAKAIESFYTEPNTAGTAAGQNNYTRSSKDTFDYNAWVWRVDHTFSDRNRAFIRMDYDRYLEWDNSFYKDIAAGLDLKRINRGGVIDDVMTLSSTTGLDLRYGLSESQTINWTNCCEICDSQGG